MPSHQTLQPAAAPSELWGWGMLVEGASQPPGWRAPWQRAANCAGSGPCRGSLPGTAPAPHRGCSRLSGWAGDCPKPRGSAGTLLLVLSVSVGIISADSRPFECSLSRDPLGLRADGSESRELPSCWVRADRSFLLYFCLVASSQAKRQLAACFNTAQCPYQLL